MKRSVLWEAASVIFTMAIIVMMVVAIVFYRGRVETLQAENERLRAEVALVLSRGRIYQLTNEACMRDAALMRVQLDRCQLCEDTTAVLDECLAREIAREGEP